MSSVQSMPSLGQTKGCPAGMQPPNAGSQTSNPLQSIPSLQTMLFGTCSQVPGSLQASAVQAIPSSQLKGGVFTQPSCGSQVSIPLQANPSSHSALLGAWLHCPVCGLQASTVHPMPSSQLT